MKRSVLFVAGLALLAAAMAWGQTTTSLESSVSFGIFTNPYDSAFNPSDSVTSGPTFTGLGKNYLFGGLTNFPQLHATTGAPSATVNSPFTLGYYAAGALPWSVLLSLQNSPQVSSVGNGVSSTTTATTAVPNGSTTTNYTWTQSTTSNAYAYLQARNFATTDQVLVGKLGPLNAGLWLNINSQQDVAGTGANAWAALNDTQTVTHFYDTTPGAKPTPKTDYTNTTVKSAPDSKTLISGSVPFYLPLSSMGMSGMSVTGSLTGTYETRDTSTSTKQTISAPQGNVTPYTFTGVQTDVSNTNNTGYFKLNGAAVMSLPALMGKNKADQFDVGLNGGVTLNNAGDHVVNNIVQAYTAAGGGAALKPAYAASNNYSTTTTTRKGTTGYNVNLTAQHYFYFQIAQPVTLGIAPLLTTGVSWAPTSTSYNVSSVNVKKNDNNTNGVYTDAADTVVTTTTTYGNNTKNGTFEVLAEITLPTAVKITPKGWPFGITLGNQMIAKAAFDKTTSNTTTTSTSAVTVDGTGAAVGTSNTTAASSTGTTSNTTRWTFTTQNNLGLNFYLPGNATLDVILNTNNFFSFDNLTVQAVVPLP